MSHVTLLPDSATRHLMLEELQLDLLRDELWLSSRLSPRGRALWSRLFALAIEEGDAHTLARSLSREGRMLAIEGRRTRHGHKTVWVPRTAEQTLAWGEFNRFFIRATCRRAIQLRLPFVVVHRGRPSRNPRPESEALLGLRLCPTDLLEEVRKAPGSGASFPPGPNSGLSIRLPLARELRPCHVPSAGVRWTEPPRAA